jgi:MYXO-CTERM domain-containing protein
MSFGRLGLAPLLAAIATLLVAPTVHAQCKGRPDGQGYGTYVYTAGDSDSFATDRVRVHWAKTGQHSPILTTTRGDGVPDSVASVADIAELALTKYAEMGYRAIPSDAGCSSNGGDGKVDIYLVKFAGADGACVAECNDGACPSFTLVESTFSGRGYKNADEGFRTVVTHELFHAVQNIYKTSDDPFWAEGTAQWAMKTVHPDLQDFERNLPSFFKEPTRSIDAPPTGVTAGYLYGAAVWPLFLATKYGPETIREVYEAEAEGKKALDATNAVLETKGSSLAEAYPLFGAWNAATDTLAGTGGYPDGASYPGIKTASLEDGVSAITSGLGYFVYRGTLDGLQEIALETDAERNGGVVVPVASGKAQLGDAKKLPANAEGEVLVVVSGITTKKTDAPFTIRIGAPGPASPDGSSGGAASPPADDGCQVSPGRSRGELPFVLAGVLALGALGRRRRR